MLYPNYHSHGFQCATHHVCAAAATVWVVPKNFFIYHIFLFFSEGCGCPSCLDSPLVDQSIVGHPVLPSSLAHTNCPPFRTSLCTIFDILVVSFLQMCFWVIISAFTDGTYRMYIFCIFCACTTADFI